MRAWLWDAWRGSSAGRGLQVLTALGVPGSAKPSPERMGSPMAGWLEERPLFQGRRWLLMLLPPAELLEKSHEATVIPPPPRRVSHPSSEAYLLYVLGMKTQPHASTCEQRVNPNCHHPSSKQSTVDCPGSAHGSSQSRLLAERSVFKTAWASSLVLRDTHQPEEEPQIPAETHPVQAVHMSFQLPAQPWQPSPCGTGLS